MPHFCMTPHPFVVQSPSVTLTLNVHNDRKGLHGNRTAVLQKILPESVEFKNIAFLPYPTVYTSVSTRTLVSYTLCHIFMTQ